MNDRLIPENSFFRRSYRGKKALLLAPHQDDETNMAPNLLKALSAQGTEVFVAYATNGDWKLPASLRFKEAAAALKLLGVPEDHMIVLGYGDTLNDPEHTHLFYAKDVPAVSPAGKSETYGTEEHPDFAFKTRGKHSTYTFKAFKDDIRAVILELRPDLLICADLDRHADHRALSLAFDKALGEILKEQNDYRPRVLKRFAYPTAYTAKADLFSGLNIPETVRPEPGLTGQYEMELVDSLCYGWGDRVRIPAVPENRTVSLSKNLTARALSCHRSQWILRFADRIINSDEVFFRRRTDSLSYSARLSAGSGDPSKLNDFMVFDTGDIDADIMEPCNCLWAPDAVDENAWVCFDWDDPQSISELAIYGNCSYKAKEQGGIENIRIVFDNGFSLETGPLPERGRALKLSFEPQKGVRSCVLSVTGASGSGWGLSECEFYGIAERFTLPAPFIKITVDGNFAYEYLVEPGVSEFALDVYRYGCEASAKLYITKGRAEIKEGSLIMDPGEKAVVLRAELMDGEDLLIDEAVIRRVSPAGRLKRKLSLIYNKALIKAFKTKRRVSLGLKRRLGTVVKG